jgi:hypothetical protein
MKYNLLNIIALILMLTVATAAQTDDKQTDQQTEALHSSGGTFTLTKSVVAGGGREMTQAQINLHGTAGQASAGIQSIGGQFSLHSGFWAPEMLAPTAAEVVAGGRIKTASGKGIKNVTVTVTLPSGEIRTAVSGAMGYYRFSDLPAGETYVFSVSAKRYEFTQSTQVRTITDDTQDIDFIADDSRKSNELPQ